MWWKTGLDVAPLPVNCFNFLYGLLYTIPAVLGKLIVGVFAKDRKLDFWVIGWAMVGNFFLIFF